MRSGFAEPFSAGMTGGFAPSQCSGMTGGFAAPFATPAGMAAPAFAAESIRPADAAWMPAPAHLRDCAHTAVPRDSLRLPVRRSLGVHAESSAGRPNSRELPAACSSSCHPQKIEREHHQRDRKHRSNRIKPSPESHRPPPSAAARAQSMSRLRRSAFSSQRRISASARKRRQRSRQTTHATSVAMPNPSVAQANSFSSDTPRKRTAA